MPNLYPIKEGAEPPKRAEIAVFDIETNGWDEFLVVGFYENGAFYSFTNFDLFVEHVLEYSRCDICFAHNGGKFDFLFLLDQLYRSRTLRSKYRIEKIVERGAALLSITVENKFSPKQEEHRRVVFTDTIAFLPYKLDTLTKTFNVAHKKLSVDHTKRKTVNEELLEYLKHDCVGLHEVVERYRSQELIANAGLKFTTASQALQVFRHYLKKPIYCLDEEEDAWCRESYFGGRTEIFKPAYFGSKAKDNRKMRIYDVNSLYPTVMRENIFPNRPRYKTKRLNLDELSIWDVTVEVPHSLHVPPLGSVIRIPSVKRVRRKNGEIVKKTELQFKFLFPVGVFRGKWTNVELKYAMTLGVKILKTHEGMIFQSAGFLFKDFINDMYARRMRAKEAKDDVNDTIAKLMMNSLYGRMGLNREREDVVIDDGRLAATPVEYTPEIVKRGFGFGLIRTPSYLHSSFTNVAIASFVTSYARIHMHKLYMKLGHDLFYTDTDSVFTTTELETGGKLGEVKLEAEGTDACFILPKTYVMTGEDSHGNHFIKAASKGMDKEYMKRYTPHDFYEMMEGEAKIIESKMKGRGLHGFRTAIQRFGKLVVPKADMVRRIMATYDKRVVYKKEGDFFTRPVEVNGSEMSLTLYKQTKRAQAEAAEQKDGAG